MQTFRRGDPGYEAARRATMWNARVPDRFPEVVAQAQSTEDVMAAVRLATREGWTIGVASGGHSWSGNHVRDGGMLLDVSRLRDAAIDREARRARVGPGCPGHHLAAQLARRRLFFPSGHCPGVAVGGFLLQGGFGWHGRVLGPACASVLALEIVTAEGELVTASETENADLYWAARGAGPGFFGVVVAFHLKLYPRPRVIGVAAQSYPIAMLEDVFRWAHQIGPDVPRTCELQLMVHGRATGVGGPGIEVLAPVLADGLGEAHHAWEFLRQCPLRKKAALKLPLVPTGLGALYRGVAKHYPDGRRWAVDNMWTSAGIDELLPGLKRIAATMPPPPTHMLWLNWAPPRNLPNMAFSLEDDLYLALYAVWKDAADDALYEGWPAQRMREMESLASGCQLADENLGQRPAKFVSDAHLARLDEIRAARDPAGRFHPWMGRP